MDWTNKLTSIRWEDIQHWLQQYESLGPIPGIVAPMLESFFPVLPLVAILVANVNAYGLGQGFLLSWIGVVAGSISVFAIVRALGGRLRSMLESRLPRTEKLIHWLEKHGFTSIFLLACFPFTPSSLVNIVSGMSRIPFHTFFTATLLGKGVMIFLVSMAGSDLGGMLRNPWKLALIIGVLALMWFIGKRLEKRYMK
ncbi:TVP38/TMEM64 family protein [Paenibacillus sp. YYML68]|uniref:TVP38/TMEM64 family protein n=1 Tax=Paenibacillus sp. YYML68 TaxID=2909250 RepID=UPI0024938065|nr:TVP38/TMEM64 family protein [Paenibacillus sp. YYML68]